MEGFGCFRQSFAFGQIEEKAEFFRILMVGKLTLSTFTVSAPLIDRYTYVLTRRQEVRIQVSLLPALPMCGRVYVFFDQRVAASLSGDAAGNHVSNSNLSKSGLCSTHES